MERSGLRWAPASRAKRERDSRVKGATSLPMTFETTSESSRPSLALGLRCTPPRPRVRAGRPPSRLRGQDKQRKQGDKAVGTERALFQRQGRNVEGQPIRGRGRGR